MRLSLVLMLCASTHALAIAKGGTLFIKSKDVSLQKDPSSKAKSVMKLQPGTQVIWNGPSSKDKTWHEVVVAGKTGFIQQRDLSPNKPQSEVDSASGKPMSAAAFASSGAATSTPYGPGINTWYKGDRASEEAAAELLYLEELNKAKATPAAVELKNTELHR